ncbi:NAD(P)/FAD-dependent oxidoreductase [Marinigracilibium pacificum]|uniref:NAD(P)/FAD-dependent oxidoreductase n=1 Tax=Marinigracilibium pacificum TaxID=2729599 RepID=A0A848ITR8_9BACT|nr:NAD(P)/FAD-dependent oxidoreductase [Marinigracilibium pacificum]NMM47737.1 NAD(P)/FAD-dependent oxidoreductase [Marinigracilibium pacificum]
MNYEVIIIGGGPAGMSAALVLGRSRIKSLVLNAENPRNSITTHSHGFLTQDGIHPSEIFKTAKEQLSKYTDVTYKNEKAIEVTKTDDYFEVRSEENSYSSNRVIIATGYRDNIKEVGIKGLEDVYGKSVYPCPFCDGFEMADKQLAVFGDAMMGPMFSKVIAHWSNDVIVFTNGEKVTDQELLKSLQTNNIRLIDKKIKQLKSIDGILSGIELEDDTIIKRQGGFIADTMAVENTNFARNLNVPIENGHFGMESYKVDENKETEIKGLYIIGDARSGWTGVAGAVNEGSVVGKAITHQIIEEHWK